MRMLAALILIAALAGCRDEAAARPDPVALTDEATGHFCQMNLNEHPGPKAQVFLKDMPHPLFFSQVRDAIAYQRLPEQSHPILAMQVNDMGAADANWDDPGQGNWIDADDAFYVLGSAREGGMGAPEAVPFGTESAAQAFAIQEGGAVMRLAQIPDKLVLAPAETGTSGNADDADFEDRLRALSHPEDKP